MVNGRLRYIHRDDSFEVIGEHLREDSNAASELQHGLRSPAIPQYGGEDALVFFPLIRTATEIPRVPAFEIETLKLKPLAARSQPYVQSVAQGVCQRARRQLSCQNLAHQIQ